MERDIVAHPSLLLADDNPALLETLIEMLEPAYRVAAALRNGGVRTGKSRCALS